MASPESLIHLPLKLLNERFDFRDGETNKDSGRLCAIKDLPLVNSWLVVMSTLSLVMRLIVQSPFHCTFLPIFIIKMRISSVCIYQVKVSYIRENQISRIFLFFTAILKTLRTAVLFDLRTLLNA